MASDTGKKAGFRDLKRDGWHFRIWIPDHSKRLLLVMALAHALGLTLGTLAVTDADLAPLVTKGVQPTYYLKTFGD